MNREAGDRHAIVEKLKQLGNVACKMGSYQEARKYLDQALRLAAEIRIFYVILDILIGVANLFQEEGHEERALELVAFITSQTVSGQELKDRARSLLSKLETELPPQTVARCRERGEASTLEVILAEILGNNLPS